MRRGRKFVIIVLMLWLPLQALAAVSMPFCAGMAGSAPTSAHAHHQHEGSTPAGNSYGSAHSDHRHAAAGTLQQCNNCGACNLACALGVPVSTQLLTQVAPTVQLHFSAHSPGLFIPDQPQPPPNSRS